MLKMGCAKIDVTPDFPVFLRGYGARKQKTALVEEPVEVGVIALEQNAKKVLMITVDNIGIQVEDCREVTARLRKEFGIGGADVMISCSHTHFAPGFTSYSVTFPDGELEQGIYPADKEYFEFWYAKTRIAVRAALDDMEAVSLDCAVIPVSGIAFNRRTVKKSDGLVQTNYLLPKNLDDFDFSPIDELFYVWRFNKGNRPKGILGRYSCHPVTGGAEFYGISADYPGYFKKCVQDEFGCPGFFLLGTAGDVVPMRRNGQSRRDLGEILARSIRLNELNFRKADDFTLATASFTVPGTLFRIANHDTMEKDYQAALADAKKHPHEYRPELAEASNRYMIAKRFADKKFDIPIQLLRLGCHVIVGLPFEVLTAIGLELRAACPEAVIASITGGYESYLPLASDFPKGGYETDDGANFEPETGNNILAACIREVKKFQA